jgi:hypothetical protein
MQCPKIIEVVALFCWKSFHFKQNFSEDAIILMLRLLTTNWPRN